MRRFHALLTAAGWRRCLRAPPPASPMIRARRGPAWRATDVSTFEETTMQTYWNPWSIFDELEKSCLHE